MVETEVENLTLLVRWTLVHLCQIQNSVQSTDICQTGDESGVINTHKHEETAVMYGFYCQQLLVSNSKYCCWLRRLKGSVGHFPQATIQQCMPATVLCTVTDLFALLFLYLISHRSTRHWLFSLLALWHALTFKTNSNSSQQSLYPWWSWNLSILHCPSPNKG